MHSANLYDVLSCDAVEIFELNARTFPNLPKKGKSVELMVFVSYFVTGLEIQKENSQMLSARVEWIEM